MFEINTPISWYDHAFWIKRWLGWPEWLPLPLNSDHGLNLSGCLEEHEAQSPSRIHLTWNPYRYQWLKHTSAKKIYLIPHPYLTMLRYKKLISQEKTGTLVFWPHGDPAFFFLPEFIDQYIDELISFAKTSSGENPLTICLHYHDYHDEYLTKKLSDFNIVCAGSPFKSGFAERLFLIISQHKFATAPMIGSYIPYCELLGCRFTLYGTAPIYFSKDTNNVFSYRQDDILGRSLESYMTELFSTRSNESTVERLSMVSALLGLDSSTSRSRLRLLAMLEFARLSLTSLLIPRIIKHYLTF